MGIKKDKTLSGKPRISLLDFYGLGHFSIVKTTLYKCDSNAIDAMPSQSKPGLNFQMGQQADRSFDQEDIRALLPYLQVFAETGIFDPGE